jgi:23S rRNA pseudouridine1911/1915/1917 synthase
LHTGRTHQVRVHLAAVGHPVVGDRLYDAPAQLGAPRPLLHAASLDLPHPGDGQRLHVDSPLPADFRPYLAATSQEQPPARP